MSELLAPAGNYEALLAAISNGADAIYLGMNQFGARAYSTNFDEETLKKAIVYAHLRNVKIYVTINTILFDEELPFVYQMIDFLNEVQIDGIILQDLAAFDYVVKKYPDIEAHCSTQMGIDDLEGTLLFKELGAKRVVLSREVPIDEVKRIRKIAKLPIEIFIHGALCVSYSGNCLMSGLIGYRSGNRGRCVGSCRKAYTLCNEDTDITYEKRYILSMKDLNTIEHIEDLKGIDSLKIEGRMKEPAYVANVVSTYRKALDGDSFNPKNLVKTFQRTFTKGYLFGEEKKDITNIERPNNYGSLIGVVASNKTSLGYKLKLTSSLYQNDIIRIDHKHTDINLTVVKLYDDKKRLISSADSSCYIQIKEDLTIGDRVYKTKDYAFYQKLEKSYPKEFKRIPLEMIVSAFGNTPLSITAICERKQVTFTSSILLEYAKTAPSSKDTVLNQLNRLSDTVYEIESLEYYADNVFIPSKLLNEARRFIVNQMNMERLKRAYRIKEIPAFLPISFPQRKPVLAVYATTEEQIEAAKECGISILYTPKNTIRRNNTTYPKIEGPVLIGGYGGIYAYNKNNEIVSDFSFNVVNSKAVYFLHSLGIHRITLSYELNKKQIEQLISSYHAQTNGYPNLEMIVYGHTHLLYTKYCPLKKYNLCGDCKKYRYSLKDEYGTFPILSHIDCSTTLLNGKKLNLIDEFDQIQNISVFRLQFTIENKEETKRIIQQFTYKLQTHSKEKRFDSSLNTRGHFNKEIL